MMRFNESLMRLRDAAGHRQTGVLVTKRIIEARDLELLLFHFDRIDVNLRNSSAPELLAENKHLKAENERLRVRVADLIGAITSLNNAKHHEVIIGDDVGYYQRKEWVEWILDLAAHP